MIERACIVGLGLMGGSLARALRPVVPHLVGVDSDPAAIAAAREAGALTGGSTELAVGVAGVQLVILATPVGTILEQLARLAALRPDGCLVLDLGSTKAAVCAAMEELPASFGAVGGHPMCGKETAGFGASSGDLYRDRTFVLCPTRRTTIAALETADWLARVIGSLPLVMAPDEHDRVVAVTSHLPYVLAAVLMGQAAAAAADDPRVWPVSASGLRDTTRLARTEPAVMTDILLTNREAVLARLRQTGDALTRLEAILVAGDEPALRDWLREKQAARLAYEAWRAGH